MPLDDRDLAAAFGARFGESPQWIIRAPGRVNLIGEHTDYNDGFVLPLAINRAVWIALRPRRDRKVVVYSADYEQQGEFDLDRLIKNGSDWIEYLKGVAWSLQEAGYRLTGWEGVLRGDVPKGAGLSSSAALEVATARAFSAADGLPWDATAMAKVGQRAENLWVGVNCGIMDQLISAAGRACHALLIDCRTLKTMPVPFPAGTAVVILDTGTRRGLVGSAYNERRARCESAAEFFGVKALRDVDLRQFQARVAGLDETTGRRARHVISENQRTLDAAESMRRNDPTSLGMLMDQSHRSLREDYEVSSDALNAMVEIAQAQPACYGARMTGAGFGGCAVAVVDSGGAEDFACFVAAAYGRQTGNTPEAYICQATNGAEMFAGHK